MTDVHFADILLILLACGVIFAILSWVNRTKKKATPLDSVAGEDDDSEKQDDGNND